MASQTMKTRNPALPRAHRGRPPLDQAARHRILEATAAVFLEKGFAKASTAEIARRARTSKQTLYHLFPTKADLFAAVMRARTDDLFRRHPEFIASVKTPRESLTEMGELALGMFLAPEFLALYRILVAEAGNFPDVTRQLWQGCMERGYDLQAEYLKSRGIGGPQFRRSAKRFVSFVLGDFLINATLNPDAELSRRALRQRVREAVDDFLCLHPAQTIRKRA